MTQKIDSLFSKEENNNYQNSRLGNIDSNSRIFHVVEQTWNRKNYFSYDSARYRSNLIYHNERKYKLKLLASVTMPNHLHELYIISDILMLQNFLRMVNSHTAIFVKRERFKQFGKNITRLFNDRPEYIPISDRIQFLNLIYYMFHNPDYLYATGKEVPYSSFVDWEKGNLKHCDIELFQEISGISFESIMKMCRNFDGASFRIEIKNLLSKKGVQNPAVFRIKN